jgi:hypothetical protein
MTASASGRMTLRDRRKVEEEVTPPPTISRKGRGVGTPRGRGGPSTPIARKAVASRFVTPPHSDHFEELDTPTAAPSVSKVEPSTSSTKASGLPNQSLRAPTNVQAAVTSSTQTQTAAQPQGSAPSQQGQPPKIVLRFTRPTPLPPAELASLPSPITPLPPSHSSIYPHLSHLNQSTTVGGSIDQRVQGQGDYMSARSLPDDEKERKESPKLPGSFV